MRKPAGVGRATRVYNTQTGSREEENERNPDLKILLLCVHNTHSHTHSRKQQTEREPLVFAFSVPICYYFPLYFFGLYYVSL
jgi:hypothetical protein